MSFRGFHAPPRLWLVLLACGVNPLSSAYQTPISPTKNIRASPHLAFPTPLSVQRGRQDWPPFPTVWAKRHPTRSQSPFSAAPLSPSRHYLLGCRIAMTFCSVATISGTHVLRKGPKGNGNAFLVPMPIRQSRCF
ncbi:hypothetical protein LZ32DRAFT_65348 [Colletotrichum eremochloae]|nr:hypothetical protein LZ32DRAFT_65348 [Colletotrichum eremochloae]